MFSKVTKMFLPVCLAVFLTGFLCSADGGAKEGVFSDTPVNNGTVTEIQMKDTYGKLPLSFIRNNGQMDERVRFYENGSGHSTFFTKRGIYLALINSMQSSDIYKGLKDSNRKQENGYSEIRNPKSEIVRLVPLCASKTPEIVTEGLQEGRVNYFTGNNPEKWKTNIPTFQSVIYKDIYKGVDMKFYGNNRQMEYDIIVKPGANPSRVQLSYQGIKGLSVTEDGDLEISLKDGKLIQKKPYLYQEIDGKKVEIDGKFRVLSSEFGVKNQNPKSQIRNPKFIYGFQVASYNKDYPLVIDPTLVYSTYLGGSNGDHGQAIAVDNNGNAYITGYTWSSNFPTASAIYGPHNPIFKTEDVFVTKINTSGNSLVYSTYLGGGRIDRADDIAVDAAGSVYITGYTNSFDFPTKNPLSTGNINIGGQTDAFVTKIDASGSSLVYSTYLGGDHPDYGWGIAADNSGNAYVTGFTNSLDFPTTASAFDTTYNGWREAFVTKIDASGNSYVYSGFLGGAWHDEAYDIAVDTVGNAYVTGYTASSDFPTVSSIYSAPRGNYDAFVTKIDASGSGIVYSTYLGGINHEQGYGIAVDTTGNSYVTGRTLSANFPTASAIYGSLSGSWDAFVTKVDASGSSLVYSTYLGGSSSDCGNSIAVDPSGNAYITGYTFSANFPMASAIYGTNKGNSDVFVTKIDATGNSLVYSTFLGGNAADHGRGIAADATGNAYVAGVTASTNFPTSSAIYGTYKGNSDVFVAKITTDTTPPTVSSTSPANGDADVAINSAITVTFSEAIDATTINISTFTISGGVSGTVTYDGANHTATFTPSSNLSNGIAYTATIAAGIKDLAGNAMVSDYTWSFTVTGAVDTTPPTVSSTSPTDGSTSVAIDTPITVTFSEAMNPSTINTSTFILSNGVTGTITYSGNAATFTPSTNLSYATTYTVTITNGVTDISGNVMTSNYTWNFTTASAPQDTTPPSVSSTNPTSGATGVGIDTSITVTFSESMDPSTFDASTFYVSGGVVGTVTCNGATATFTPSTSLSYVTLYTVTITNGVKDISGNAMTTNYTWSFTTSADTTPPIVISTTPSDGASSVAINTSITATFSEAMTASTINTSTFTLSGGVTGAVTYGNNIATFTPSTNLSYGTTYTATITNGVRDLRGNAMTANYTWSFTTGSNVAESIVVSPTELQLTKMTSRTVVVTVSGANGFPIKGATVNTTVDATGQNLVTVSPTSNVTDTNGQATFTISAMNTTVETKVNFQASGLNKTAVVAVKVL